MYEEASHQKASFFVAIPTAMLCIFVAALFVFFPFQIARGQEKGSAGVTAKKVALIIGNANYQKVPALKNTVNDASDISAALKKLGFDVVYHRDLTVERMLFVLRDFSRRSENADAAVVYYGGHGIEIAGSNYLIPTDATLERDTDVQYEAIPLEMLTGAVAKTKGLRLIILDACRDNPFVSLNSTAAAYRISGRGLKTVSTGGESLIVYAAKEGTVALDGDGRNSPFTQAFLKHLPEPGLEVSLLFRKVRDDVLTQTAGRQEPFTYGSLSSQLFYFTPPKAVNVDVGKSVEIAYWAEVETSKSEVLIQSYIRRYPQGQFVDQAKKLIAELRPLPAPSLPVVPKLPSPTNTSPLAVPSPATTAPVAEKRPELVASLPASPSSDGVAQSAPKLISVEPQNKPKEIKIEAPVVLPSPSVSPEISPLRVSPSPNPNQLNEPNKADEKKPEIIAALPPKNVELSNQLVIERTMALLTDANCFAPSAGEGWSPKAQEGLLKFSQAAKLKLANLEPSAKLLESLEPFRKIKCPPLNVDLKKENPKVIEAIKVPEKKIVQPQIKPKPVSSTPAPSVAADPAPAVSPKPTASPNGGAFILP